MSEKRPFDAAIDAIRGWQRVIEAYSEMHIDEIADLEEAVHVLLDWHKWKPLIEAAGKVDKANALYALGNVTDYVLNGRGQSWVQFEAETRALLEALPDKEEKP